MDSIHFWSYTDAGPQDFVSYCEVLLVPGPIISKGLIPQGHITGPPASFAHQTRVMAFFPRAMTPISGDLVYLTKMYMISTISYPARLLYRPITCATRPFLQPALARIVVRFIKRLAIATAPVIDEGLTIEDVIAKHLEPQPRHISCHCSAAVLSAPRCL